MNYRERMRKAVECPQFGTIDYGEWGSLNLIQRKDIKRLLDEMDRADEYIKTLYFKNENLQSKIDKISEYVDKIYDVMDYKDYPPYLDEIYYTLHPELKENKYD